MIFLIYNNYYLVYHCYNYRNSNCIQMYNNIILALKHDLTGNTQVLPKKCEVCIIIIQLNWSSWSTIIIISVRLL